MERIFLMLSIICLTAFSFISGTEIPVKSTPPILYQSKPDFPAIDSNSFSSNSSLDTDKVELDYKEVPNSAEEVKIKQANEKDVSIDSTDSEKPYRVIDGIAYVLSQGGYATTGEFTDIIYVDGKQMSPDEVNKSIKRSSVKGVGATGGEAAQKKYGLNKPVLEIYINTSPQINNMLLQGPAKEQKPFFQEQEAKRKEQTDNEREQIYDQQRHLAMQEKELQKQEEMMQKQKKVLARQQALIEQAEQFKMQAGEQVKEQAKQDRIQAEQAKEQVRKAKLQREIVDTLRQEMVKDGLIKPNELYNATFDINSKEMLINGKKQPTAVHQKYLKIIGRKREKAFGKTEESRSKE